MFKWEKGKKSKLLRETLMHSCMSWKLLNLNARLRRKKIFVLFYFNVVEHDTLVSFIFHINETSIIRKNNLIPRTFL